VYRRYEITFAAVGLSYKSLNGLKWRE